MTNGNDLIHSFQHTDHTEGNFHGLTKREYFAAMAMQGIMSYNGTVSASENYAARLAVSYADALIKALNEEP